MTGRTTAAAAALMTLALALTACSGDKPAAKSDLEVVVNPTTNADGVAVPESRFFSESSPWNTRIDGSPADPRSAQMMTLARERVGVVVNGNTSIGSSDGSTTLRVDRSVVDAGVYINTEAWTTPVVAGGQPTKLVCRQLVCGDGAETQVLDVPADVDPDPRYDGWFTVFDVSKPIAYDLWRARREDDGTISYNYMRKWDLNGPGFQAPQLSSARGSGLPLFAGLIRPNELQAGLINHALAISLPGPAQGTFVQPASTTDGNGRPSSVPEGARIRLKANVTLPVPTDPKTGKPIKLTTQQKRMSDAIVAALRTYGAIVVDRAAVPTLYAQRDVTADMIAGNELSGLRLDDFEVVKLGKKYQFPPDDENGSELSSPSSPSAPTSTGADQ